MHSVKATNLISTTNYNPPLNEVTQVQLEEVLLQVDGGDYKVYTAERTRTVSNPQGWTRQISELVDAPHKLLKELGLA